MEREEGAERTFGVCEEQLCTEQRLVLALEDCTRELQIGRRSVKALEQTCLVERK